MKLNKIFIIVLLISALIIAGCAEQEAEVPPIDNVDSQIGDTIQEEPLSDAEDFRINYTTNDKDYETLYISQMDSFYTDDMWYVNYLELGQNIGGFRMDEDKLKYDHLNITITFYNEDETERKFNMDNGGVVIQDLDNNRIDADGKIYVPVEVIMKQINEYSYSDDGKQMDVIIRSED